MVTFPLKTSGLIILPFPADLITCCHVFVELGMTKPKSKVHSSMHVSPIIIVCRKARLETSTSDEKFISLETMEQSRIDEGIFAELIVVEEYSLL